MPKMDSDSRRLGVLHLSRRSGLISYNDARNPLLFAWQAVFKAVNQSIFTNEAINLADFVKQVDQFVSFHDLVWWSDIADSGVVPPTAEEPMACPIDNMARVRWKCGPQRPPKSQPDRMPLTEQLTLPFKQGAIRFTKKIAFFPPVHSMAMPFPKSTVSVSQKDKSDQFRPYQVVEVDEAGNPKQEALSRRRLSQKKASIWPRKTLTDDEARIYQDKKEKKEVLIPIPLLNARSPLSKEPPKKVLTRRVFVSARSDN
jgi:hypothetical protein